MFVQGSIPFPHQPSITHRKNLDDRSWVELFPGWLAHPDTTFDELLAASGWCQRRIVIWDREVDEPRLTRGWPIENELGSLAEIRQRLSALLAVPLASFWVNLYRDGNDAVAWHSDRVAKSVHNPVVATITLGSQRKFFLRRRSGGPSICFQPGPGDLLIMGGACQHEWQHCVPRCRDAGPRMAITIRQRSVDLTHQANHLADDNAHGTYAQSDTGQWPALQGQRD